MKFDKLQNKNRRNEGEPQCIQALRLRRQWRRPARESGECSGGGCGKAVEQQPRPGRKLLVVVEQLLSRSWWWSCSCGGRSSWSTSCGGRSLWSSSRGGRGRYSGRERAEEEDGRDPRMRAASIDVGARRRPGRERRRPTLVRERDNVNRGS
jgi:hypothetical protein